MQGDEAGVVEAVTIITAAVDRYKDLCEGRCSGERAEQGVKGACVRAGAVVRGQSGGAEEAVRWQVQWCEGRAGGRGR